MIASFEGDPRTIPVLCISITCHLFLRMHNMNTREARLAFVFDLDQPKLTCHDANDIECSRRRHRSLGFMSKGMFGMDGCDDEKRREES